MHLRFDQLQQILDLLPNEQVITIERVRYKNKIEIRKVEQMMGSTLKDLLIDAYEDGHLHGGDLEVMIESLNQKLIAHHDGIYWLQSQ